MLAGSMSGIMEFAAISFMCLIIACGEMLGGLPALKGFLGFVRFCTLGEIYYISTGMTIAFSDGWRDYQSLYQDQMCPIVRWHFRNTDIW